MRPLELTNDQKRIIADVDDLLSLTANIPPVQAVVQAAENCYLDTWVDYHLARHERESLSNRLVLTDHVTGSVDYEKLKRLNTVSIATQASLLHEYWPALICYPQVPDTHSKGHPTRPMYAVSEMRLQVLRGLVRLGGPCSDLYAQIKELDGKWYARRARLIKIGPVGQRIEEGWFIPKMNTA